jgi:hypothetical protein
MQIRSLHLFLSLGLMAGCGGGGGRASGSTEGITGSNQKDIPRVDSELCDTSGKQVQTFDLNQDNNPDVWKLYATVEEDGTKVEVLTCKQVDYDHDGKKDYVAIYNKTGEMVAEEFDFTFDGRFDAREHYDKKGGKIFMVERDLDHNKNPDTWERYDIDGNLESVERDRNGDGKADLWEQYQRGVLLAILYDDDYDRKVDRKESGRPSVNFTRPSVGGGASGSAAAGGASGSASGSGSAGAKTPAAAGDSAADKRKDPGLVEEAPTVPGQAPAAGAKAKPGEKTDPKAKSGDAAKGTEPAKPDAKPDAKAEPK